MQATKTVKIKYIKKINFCVRKVKMALNRYNYPFFGIHDSPFLLFPHQQHDPLDDLLMPVVPSFARTGDMILRHSSPGYEIHETDDNYQIAVDVPGIRMNDMNVELLDNGKVLHISGGRKVVKDNETSETKFDKRFTLGGNVETEKLTANLADGVLVLTAPKRKEQEKVIRKIAIMEGPVPAAAIEEKKTDA